MPDKNKGASLNPEDHAGGGSVPDGDYTIAESYAGSFDYNGQVPEGVPAIIVLYKSDDGQSYEQPYKAGDNEHLVPSEDHERFVHPRGEEARIYKGGAASQWLGSLAKVGYKFTGDSVKQFKGLRVHLVNTAAPKGRGNDVKEGKTIPLVDKLLPNQKGKAAAASAPGQSTSAVSTSSPAPSASHAGGSEVNLTEQAITLVQQALADAPDNTITRMRLATKVMVLAAKNPGLKQFMQQMKKLTEDASWLVENQETGAWTTDGEEVKLG